VQYVFFIAVAASLGLHYMGYAFIVANLITMGIWLFFTQRAIGFKASDFLKAVAQSGIVAAAAAIVPAIVFFWLGATPADRILPLAVAVPGSIAMFLAAVVWLNHPLLAELQRVAPRLNSLLRRG
jgi:hypothetical protein